MISIPPHTANARMVVSRDCRSASRRSIEMPPMTATAVWESAMVHTAERSHPLITATDALVPGWPVTRFAGTRLWRGSGRTSDSGAGRGSNCRRAGERSTVSSARSVRKSAW